MTACTGVCATDRRTCTHDVKGHVTTARMSRTPDERLYGSGTHDTYAFTQCYVSLGDPDGADFAFTKCDAEGNFNFTGIPAATGDHVFDQWNDQIVDGITTPVGLARPRQPSIWATLRFTSGRRTSTPDLHRRQRRRCLDQMQATTSLGSRWCATNIRFRDGSYSNFNSTDLNGYRRLQRSVPAVQLVRGRNRFDPLQEHRHPRGLRRGRSGRRNTCGCRQPRRFGHCHASGQHRTRPVSLPTALRVPGSVYCDNADCTGFSIANGPAGDSSGQPRLPPAESIRPGFGSYGWQGFSGQNTFLEFGKKPFAAGENGGIHGHVVYASTRPFDDPQLLLQLSWEPLVPHVTHQPLPGGRCCRRRARQL